VNTELQNCGLAVRFPDWLDGQMRSGTVVALRDTQLTRQDEGTRREWKLPKHRRGSGAKTNKWTAIQRFADM